jgi:peptidoglycan/xylan/chitin deacetylase (PgdA/CDA1 family)
MSLNWELSRLAKALLDGVVTGLGIVVYYLGLAPLVISLGRQAPRVLMYHACDEREGDFTRGLSINTRPARLAAQLDLLRKHYRVIPLEALGQLATHGRDVVITFDDGFRSVYENALPLLAARSLPATCYLVTDRLDDHSPIWINELNWFLRRHRGAARAIISRRLGIGGRCSMPVFIQGVIARYDPSVIAALLTELRSTLGPPVDEARPHLNRDEIAGMARRGFRFGNHTATHAVLSRLDESACREEIGRARAALRGLPGAIDSLAYPFGRYGEATSRIARGLGYSTLMDVEGDNDPLDLDHVGRLNVCSDSPAVLFARMELLARIKPRIKRLGRRILRRPGR